MVKNVRLPKEPGLLAVRSSRNMSLLSDGKLVDWCIDGANHGNGVGRVEHAVDVQLVSLLSANAMVKQTL